METFDINDVEVFAEGTWNGDSYSIQDLDEIVNTFNETKDHLKPYLKLGHSEKQKLLAEDELPAAGWVENLKRMGNKLVADFKRIPRKIYEIIKNGGYKRVSIELYVNAKIKDKEFPKALKAIALLGGATPAVGTLDDIRALYGSDAVALAFKVDSPVKAYESDLTIVKEQDYVIEKRGDKYCLMSKNTGETIACHPTMAAAQAQERAIKSKEMSEKGEVKQMEKEMETLRTENADLKKQLEESSKKYAELSSQVDQFKLDARKAELKNKLAKFIQDKKISPAQEEILMSILMNAHSNGQKSFKIADKEYKTMDDMVFAFVDSNSNGLPTDEKSKMGKKFKSEDGKEEVEVDGDILTGIADDKKIEDYSQEHKVSYKEAMIALSGSGALSDL